MVVVFIVLGIDSYTLSVEGTFPQIPPCKGLQLVIASCALIGKPTRHDICFPYDHLEVKPTKVFDVMMGTMNNFGQLLVVYYPTDREALLKFAGNYSC